MMIPISPPQSYLDETARLKGCKLALEARFIVLFGDACIVGWEKGEVLKAIAELAADLTRALELDTVKRQRASH